MSEEKRLRESLTGLVAWNDMVKAFEKAETAWEKFNFYAEAADVEELSLLISRGMVMSRGTGFNKVLPDLVRFWATSGGLGELVIPQEVIKNLKARLEKLADDEEE